MSEPEALVEWRDGDTRYQMLSWPIDPGLSATQVNVWMRDPSNRERGWWEAASYTGRSDDGLRALARELHALREAISELLRWGVELDDPRMKYLVVQVSRVALDELRDLLPNTEPATGEEVPSGNA